MKTTEGRWPQSREVPRKEDARRLLGTRIVALRERKGWSQARLARQLGVGRTRLGKWETGEHAPPLHLLIALKEALEVSFDQLLEAGSPLPEGLGREGGR